MGFLAEEVGRIVPEVVGFEDANNVSNWYIDSATGEKTLYATGLDYGALTPMLVESIKELKTEKDTDVESLKKENANLQNQINNLQAQIDEIKNQINSNS